MKEELQQEHKPADSKLTTDFNYKHKIVWSNFIIHTIIQCMFLYGVYLVLFVVSWKTTAWAYLCVHIAYLGVTVGAHRLYSHRAFKAHFLLRLILILFNTISGQYSLHTWVRDHRTHHRFTDTDADPHNSTRGIFFSHIGWILVHKHPAVIANGKSIDLSDIEADPLVMFQKKYFLPLYFVVSVLIPVAVPMYFWNETFLYSFMTAYGFRYGFSLHTVWLINSGAHMYGMRPYDKNIRPTDSKLVGVFTYGDGWHNYHHTFASDYRSSELGFKYSIATKFIEFFASIGLAYDLRTASEDAIQRRMLKTGDGSRTTLYS